MLFDRRSGREVVASNGEASRCFCTCPLVPFYFAYRSGCITPHGPIQGWKHEAFLREDPGAEHYLVVAESGNVIPHLRQFYSMGNARRASVLIMNIAWLHTVA